MVLLILVVLLVEEVVLLILADLQEAVVGRPVQADHLVVVEHLYLEDLVGQAFQEVPQVEEGFLANLFPLVAAEFLAVLEVLLVAVEFLANLFPLVAAEFLAVLEVLLVAVGFQVILLLPVVVEFLAVLEDLLEGVGFLGVLHLLVVVEFLVDLEDLLEGVGFLGVLLVGQAQRKVLLLVFLKPQIRPFLPASFSYLLGSQVVACLFHHHLDHHQLIHLCIFCKMLASYHLGQKKDF